MADMIVIIAIFLALVLGGLTGKKLSKKHNLFIKKSDKLILENAKKVIEGKKENKTDINGKIVSVDKFRLRDDDDNEKIIDLAGNEQKQIKKEIKEEEIKPLQSIPETNIKKEEIVVKKKSVKKKKKAVKKKKKAKKKVSRSKK